jgi:hypothetical protein
LRAVVRFAAVFFAAGLRAAVFFAAGLRAAVFFAAGLRAAGLRAVVFFAVLVARLTVFFAVDLALAAVFLAAVDARFTVFFAVDRALAAADFDVDFRVVAMNSPPSEGLGRLHVREPSARWVMKPSA